MKDTTFTDYSEFQKNVKKYPFIKRVVPIHSNKISEQDDVIYSTENGRDLHLDAYIFQSKKKKPAVILIHGGGWKSGDKKMMKSLAQNISIKGYNCFSIEYRLSDEAKYPTSINDVVNAIQFLKTNAHKYNIDTTKVAILGCSSGGQMAALIGTKFPKLIKAIIDIDGILAFHHPQSQESKLASLWLGGDYEKAPQTWEDAAALNHVNKNTPSILFINSQFERFHAGRDDMITLLKQFSIDYKIVNIENSPHTFWMFHPWYDATIQYITTFLDQKFKH